MTTKIYFFHLFFLSLFSLPIFSEKLDEQLPDYAVAHKAMWQGWSLSLEMASNFKTFLGADYSKFTTSWGHDSRFWGEFGLSGALGFKYARTFSTSWYWGIKSMWTFFYPDVRWKGEKSKITLSSIPLIGNYISLGSAPGYLTMLIPILYFDIGYITKKGYVFALGSAYLWGLSPSVLIPFDDHWSLEFRSTIFLDRLIFNSGYHNLLMGVSGNYKF